MRWTREAYQREWDDIVRHFKKNAGSFDVVHRALCCICILLASAHLVHAVIWSEKVHIVLSGKYGRSQMVHFIVHTHTNTIHCDHVTLRWVSLANENRSRNIMSILPSGHRWNRCNGLNHDGPIPLYLESAFRQLHCCEQWRWHVQRTPVRVCVVYDLYSIFGGLGHSSLPFQSNYSHVLGQKWLTPHVLNAFMNHDRIIRSRISHNFFSPKSISVEWIWCTPNATLDTLTSISSCFCEVYCCVNTSTNNNSILIVRHAIARVQTKLNCDEPQLSAQTMYPIVVVLTANTRKRLKTIPFAKRKTRFFSFPTQNTAFHDVRLLRDCIWTYPASVVCWNVPVDMTSFAALVGYSQNTNKFRTDSLWLLRLRPTSTTSCIAVWCSVS